MKKFAILLIGLITLSSTTFATTTTGSESTARYNAMYDGSKYVFVENGIEFSVFPDGEFDFYIPEIVQGINVNVNAGPFGISYNTGYDYDPFVQYDQYGAVIQIENTPIFYDNYGRLIQAGDVRINYRRNRIVNVGGLFVHYNNFGVFSHYTGFVNIYNRNYVFHPYHNFFYRPVFNRCLVWTTPYRQFYNPLRFNYAFHRNNYARGYRNGYANARRDFRRPNTGRIAHNNGRRDNVDRNNAAFRSVRNDRATNRGNRGIVSNNARDGRNGVRGDARDGRNGVRGDARVNRTNPRGLAANSNRKDRAIKGTTSRATKPNSRGTNRSVRGNATTRSNRATTTKRNNTNRKATSNRSTPQRRATSKPSNSRNTRATSSKSRNTSSRATSRSTSSRSKASSRSNTTRSSRATKSKSSNGRRG